jgi:hypothetical protein
VKANDNAAKICGLLEAGAGHADLYRTIEAGPSGQRADLRVGRIRYLPDGPDDFVVIDPSTADTVGYARRTSFGEWSMTSYNDHDGYRWVGYASSLSVGCDVLVFGEFAATGRHDARRISSGRIRKGPENPTVGAWRDH